MIPKINDGSILSPITCALKILDLMYRSVEILFGTYSPKINNKLFINQMQQTIPKNSQIS